VDVVLTVQRFSVETTMVDEPTSLDEHRGMSAQVATELRRTRAGVKADQAALQQRRDDLEKVLTAAPSEDWPEAVEKARYLLSLFAETPAAADPRRQKLIKDLLHDFERLLRVSPSARK
jgi:hypothetical protein